LADGATSKVERTRKRFWKNVDVAYVEESNGKPAHLVIRLDGRSLKTPSGVLLAVPTNRPLLASLIAREWAEQDKVLHQHSLPMTSIAARAIDGMETEARRLEIVDALVEYMHTETICFHEDSPPILVQLQEQRWQPILQWTQKRFDTPPIKVFDDIFGVQQDEEVVNKLRAHVSTYDGFDLAALERIVRSTKSFLIGIRLVEAIRTRRADDELAFGVDDAALAADVEVESQTQRWGEVEDTHDVDYADIRKILGSAACALVRDTDEAARKVAKEVLPK
jgi:ATP synthase F1 complex assembly factor 2